MAGHSTDIVGIGSSHRHVQAQYEDALDDLQESGALVSAEEIDINAVPKESLADAIAEIADGRFPDDAGDFMNIQVALHRLDEDPGHIDGVPSTRQQNLALREARRIGKREEWLRGEYEFTSGPYKGVKASSTQVAIYSYQTRHDHLANDAIVGPNTLAQIEADLRELPSPPAAVDTAREETIAALEGDTAFQSLAGKVDFTVEDDGVISAMAVRPDAVFNEADRRALSTFIDGDFAGQEVEAAARAALSETSVRLGETEADLLGANADLADAISSLSIRGDGTITEVSMDSTASYTQDRLDSFLGSGPFDLSADNLRELQSFVEAPRETPLQVLERDPNYQQIASKLNVGAINEDIIAFSSKAGAEFNNAERQALATFASSDFSGVSVTSDAREQIRDISRTIIGAEENFLESNPDLAGPPALVDSIIVSSNGVVTDFRIAPGFNLTTGRLETLTSQGGVQINADKLRQLRARAQAGSSLEATNLALGRFSDVLDLEAMRASNLIGDDGVVQDFRFLPASEDAFEYRGRLERLEAEGMMLASAAEETLLNQFRSVDSGLRASFDAEHSTSALWRGASSQGHLFDLKSVPSDETEKAAFTADLDELLETEAMWSHPTMAGRRTEFEELSGSLTEPSPAELVEQAREAVVARLDSDYEGLFKPPVFVRDSAQIKNLEPVEEGFLSGTQITSVQRALADEQLTLESGARENLQLRVQASQSATEALGLVEGSYNQVVDRTSVVFNERGQLQQFQLVSGLETPTESQFTQLEALLSEDNPALRVAIDAVRAEAQTQLSAARVARETQRITGLYGNVLADGSLQLGPNGAVSAFATNSPVNQTQRDELQALLSDDSMFASPHSFYRSQQQDLQSLFAIDNTMSFRFEAQQGVTALTTGVGRDSEIPSDLKYTLRDISFPNVDREYSFFNYSSALANYPQVEAVYDKEAQDWLLVTGTEGERSRHRYAEGVLQLNRASADHHIADPSTALASRNPPAFFREAFVGRHGFRFQNPEEIRFGDDRFLVGDIVKQVPTGSSTIGEPITIAYNRVQNQWHFVMGQDASGGPDLSNLSALESSALNARLEDLDSQLLAFIQANGLGN